MSLQGLRVVCQDMFFSRSQNSVATPTLLGTTPSNSRVALETALGSVKSSDEKVNLVNALIDAKVDTPTKLEFTDQVS